MKKKRKIIIIIICSFIILILLGSIIKLVISNNEDNKNISNEKIDLEISYIDKRLSNIYTQLISNETINIDWTKIEKEMYDLYSSWNSIIIDLNGIQIKNIDLVNFGKKADEIYLNIYEKNTNNILSNISDLYYLLSLYTNNYNSNIDIKVNMNSKYHLIKAYSLLYTNNWTLIDENIIEVEKIYYNYINSVYNNFQNNLNINKIYVSIKELENSIKLKNKEIFKIKIKIVLDNY